MAGNHHDDYLRSYLLKTTLRAETFWIARLDFVPKIALTKARLAF